MQLARYKLPHHFYPRNQKILNFWWWNPYSSPYLSPFSWLFRWFIAQTPHESRHPNSPKELRANIRDWCNLRIPLWQKKQAVFHRWPWQFILVGGIPTPLKNMSSSMGRILPYMMEKCLKPTTRYIYMHAKEVLPGVYSWPRSVVKMTWVLPPSKKMFQTLKWQRIGFLEKARMTLTQPLK